MLPGTTVACRQGVIQPSHCIRRAPLEDLRRLGNEYLTMDVKIKKVAHQEPAVARRPRTIWSRLDVGLELTAGNDNCISK